MKTVRRIVTPNGSACARCGDTTVVIIDDRYSFECCETCGHEQNGTTSGEPWNSGMEDYLGIEDR